MKILFIVGIILLIGGVTLASAGARPMTSLSELGKKTVSYSILGGFILIIISSAIYLRK